MPPKDIYCDCYDNFDLVLSSGKRHGSHETDIVSAEAIWNESLPRQVFFSSLPSSSLSSSSSSMLLSYVPSDATTRTTTPELPTGPLSNSIWEQLPMAYSSSYSSYSLQLPSSSSRRSMLVEITAVGGYSPSPRVTTVREPLEEITNVYSVNHLDINSEAMDVEDDNSDDNADGIENSFADENTVI